MFGLNKKKKAGGGGELERHHSEKKFNFFNGVSCKATFIEYLLWGEKKKNRRSQINFMVNYFHKVNLSEVMDVVSLVPSGDSRV